MMPSPYTSQESLEDAAEAAELLGITYDSISIKDAMTAFDTMLTPVFADLEADTTEENIQARARHGCHGFVQQTRVYAANHRQ